MIESLPWGIPASGDKQQCQILGLGSLPGQLLITSYGL